MKDTKDTKTKSNPNPLKTLRKEQGEQAWIRRISGSVMSAIGFFMALLIWQWQAENRADQIRAEAFLALRYELNQVLPTLDSLANSMTIQNQNLDYPGYLQANSAKILLEDPALLSKIHINTRLMLTDVLDFQTRFAYTYRQMQLLGNRQSGSVIKSDTSQYHRQQVIILAKLWAKHCHQTIKHIDELGFHI